MFKYFPTNYVWNLSVDLAIEMGARIGEIEEMCAPLQEAAKQRDKEGTQAFRDTWANMADKLCGLADEDIERGRLLSAGEQFKRASSRVTMRRGVWSSINVLWNCSKRVWSWAKKTASALRSLMKANICRHCM